MKSYHQFSVDVIRNMDEPMHLHPDIEVLYCLEGELEVRIRDKKYIMHKDDVILINSSVQHSLHLEGSNILCRVRYEYQLIAEMISNASCLFLCNSCVDQEKSFDAVREIMREIVYLEVLYNRKTDSYKYSLLYKLLDVLVEYYMESNAYGQISVEEYGTDEKLQKIMHYIHQNFQNGVSLSELADQMFISTSTLSRFFKKQTGIYFAEYVNQVRIRYAISELLYSDKNITKIAMDCGFSNASVFNKVFRENYGMAPTEYRMKKLEEVRTRKEEQENIQKELKEELQEKTKVVETESSKGMLKVELDTTNSQNYRKFWQDTICIGPLGNLNRINVQFQVEILQKNLHPTHIRVWSVLSEKLMMTDGKTIGNYNFGEIDTILDFLVSHHIHLWLDFSSKPDFALRSIGDMVYMNEDRIRFVSRNAWETFFKSLIEHWVLRYGREEVEQWIFEIGSDHFIIHDVPYYEDPEYDFYNVYDFAYTCIRNRVPKAEILGIGAISNTDPSVTIDFLKHCDAVGNLPSAVSFQMFPYEPQDESAQTSIRSSDREFELHQVEALQKALRQSGHPELPIAVSEWNITPSNRNFLNDSCFRGTYYLKTVSKLFGKVKYFNNWTGTDWVGSYLDVYEVAHGGAGLLTKDGLGKPIFYAMYFLSRLGGEVIDIGENYIATKIREDEFQILFFNLNWYSPNYFLQAENAIRPGELDSIFPEDAILPIDVILKGVSSNCSFTVKKRAINREHGCILDEWGKFQYESNLTRNDVKYLQDVCTPSLSMEHVSAKEDRLALHIALHRQEFALYHIYRNDI
ncbi:MAG: helix-turn-helix domain-containing protein [Eubacteriales bacterium]|nr:helix-turn-helix domain-containing protein [Eubacteriales bacterium]